MDISRLWKPHSRPDENDQGFLFMKEIVTRLYSILGDELDLDECGILVRILSDHTLEWSDGFAVNQDHTAYVDATAVGFTTGEHIAACLCKEPDITWKDVKSARLFLGFPSHNQPIEPITYRAGKCETESAYDYILRLLKEAPNLTVK